MLLECVYTKFQDMQIKPQCHWALTHKVAAWGPEGGCGRHTAILQRDNGCVHYLDHGDGLPPERIQMSKCIRMFALNMCS